MEETPARGHWVREAARLARAKLTRRSPVGSRSAGLRWWRRSSRTRDAHPDRPVV